MDWKTLGLLDYPLVIETPMDLGTVRSKLEHGVYTSSKQFRKDVNLVWTNCMTYNADGSDAHLIASNLMKVFEEKYLEMIEEEEEFLDFEDEEEPLNFEDEGCPYEPCSKKQLAMHKMIHKVEGGFPCKVKGCRFVAVSKELLATHMNLYHH